MKKTIEKVENKIWGYGKLILNTVLINGTKDTKNNRRDAFYYTTYDSKKYDDVPKLDRLTISTQPYLVLSYRDFSEGNAPEEIFMSFKQVELFKNFLNETLSQLIDNIDEIYKKNGIAKKYEDLAFESEKMTNDKTVIIIPQVLTNESNTGTYNGVTLIIVDADGNEFEQDLSLDSFMTLCNIVDNYDLLTDSRLTMLIAMNYGSGTGESSGGGSKLNSRMNGRKSSKSSSLKGRKSLSSIMKEEADDDDEDDEEEVEIDEYEDDEEEEVVETKPKKKLVNTSKAKSKTAKKNTKSATKVSTMSIDDMIDAADDEEFSLSDDDDEETF